MPEALYLMHFWKSFLNKKGILFFFANLIIENWLSKAFLSFLSISMIIFILLNLTKFSLIKLLISPKKT